MNYGLDIGPDAIRVAIDTPDGVILESASARATPADAETGSARGIDAEPSELLLSNGVLTADSDVEPALEARLQDVLDLDDASDGQLCYTTPGTLVDAAEPTDARRDAVGAVLADRGLDVTPIHSGFAVVYDQFADDNYTGLGVRLGPQTTSVALAYYGVPAVAFSLAKGSDWVVDRATDETDHEQAAVASALETFALDPDAATDEVEAALTTAFDALIGDLADALEREAGSADIQRGLAVPLAVAGPDAVEGLEYLLAGRVDSTLPISVRDPRRADEPAAGAARGALAAAKDGVEAHEAVTWSPADADDGDGTDGSVTVTEPTGETTLTFDDALDGGADADRARADDAIEQLFDRLADRDDEIQSIRADLESAVDDLDELDARTASADAVAALEGDLERIAEELRDLEAESARHASKQTVSTLEGNLETLSTAFDGVENDVGDLESALEDEFDTLEATIETLETTTADERAALDDRISDLVDDLDGVSGCTDTLDDRLEALRTEVESLETTTASAADLDAVTETVSRLDGELDTVGEDVARLGSRSDGLADRLEEQATRIGSVADRLTARAEQADEKRAQLEDGLETVETSLKDELGTVERDLETITERLGDLDGQIAELGGELETTATVLETTDERLGSTEDRVGALDEALIDVRERLHDRTDGLDARLETARETITALEETAADDERVAAVEDDLTTVETVVADLEDDVSAVSEIVETLEERTAPVEAVEDLEIDLDGVGDDLDSLTDSVRALEERVDETAIDLEARLEDATETIDDEVTALECRLERTVEKSVDDLAATLDRADDSTEAQLSAIETRVSDLESAIETDRVDDFEAIRTDLETVQNQIETDAAPALGTQLAAGGGGAGVVAGSVAALTGEATVGIAAVVVGVVLIAAVIVRDRS